MKPLSKNKTNRAEWKIRFEEEYIKNSWFIAGDDIDAIELYIGNLLSSTLEGLKMKEKKTEVKGIPLDGHYEIAKINGYNQAVSKFNSRITDLQEKL